MFFTTTSLAGCGRSSVDIRHDSRPRKRTRMFDESTGARTLVAFALSFTIGACGRPDRDRSEAAHVLRALEVVRSAPNEGKKRPVDELAHEPCNSPIVCGAHDRCAEAYQHLARGTEAALRVKSE